MNIMEDAQQRTKTTPGTEHRSNGLAIASMIVGIVGFFTGLWLIGVILGIVAIVLGIISLTKKMSGKGMAIAGIATGGAAIILTIVFYGLLVIALLSSDPNDSSRPNDFPNYKQFEQQLKGRPSTET